MTVARILAQKGRDVTTVEPHVSLKEVIDILAEKHIGAIIVADASQTMHGIVSERDIVRAIAKVGPKAVEDPVSSYMTKKVVTTTEDEGVLDVAQRMSSGRFRHMPVVEHGRVVGIVSSGDVIKYRLEMMQRDQEALREYIASG